MNAYEQKIADKRERYATLATRKQTESDQAYKKAASIADMIPFGQPILVGHHSERGHRKALSTIDSNMRKSIEADKTATYYANKAENYGNNGISSEDPDALAKLEIKLANALAEHEGIKARRKLNQAAAYELSNSNGRIRAIKERIKVLERMGNLEAISASGEGWEIYEDDSRICFKSPSKPDTETIGKLKHRGFKWSPTRAAWVRLKTPNAIYSTKLLIRDLTT